MDVKRCKAYQKAPLKSRRQSPTKWNTLPIYGDRAFECAPSGKRRRARTNKTFFAVQSGREANGNFEYPTPIPEPRHCARALPGGVSMRSRCHAPCPCPVVRSRRGRARCPYRPWRLPTAVRGLVRSRCGRARCPHRAAAPPARCAALHPAPPGANAIVARALPGRRDGDIAPYRHYTREWHPAPSLAPRCRAPHPRPVAVRPSPTPAHCPWRLATPGGAYLAATARGGSPPSRLAPHCGWGHRIPCRIIAICRNKTSLLECKV